MTEIQFLIDLILNEPMTKELSEKLLKRIGTIEMEKVGQPKLAPFDPAILRPQNPQPAPQITVPYISTPNIILTPVGCEHQYPNPWFGTVPPACIKCGQQAFPNFIVTCSGLNL